MLAVKPKKCENCLLLEAYCMSGEKEKHHLLLREAGWDQVWWLTVWLASVSWGLARCWDYSKAAAAEVWIQSRLLQSQVSSLSNRFPCL